MVLDAILRVRGNPMFIVVQKLKAVKAALKKWNTLVFGRTNERVIRAGEQLHLVQSTFGQQSLR